MSTQYLLAPLGSLFLAAILGGCYSLPVSHSTTGGLETGAAPGERISLTVRSYTVAKAPDGDKPAESAPATESAKAELHRCLVEELREPKNGLPFVVVEPLASAATPAGHMEPPNFGRRSATAPAAIPAAQSGIRYAVVVDAERFVGKSETLVVPLLLIMIYKHSVLETLEYKASIYDLDRASLAGTVVAYSGGLTGTNAGYIGYYGGFEHKYLDSTGMCRELATGIRGFLAGKS